MLAAFFTSWFADTPGMVVMLGSTPMRLHKNVAPKNESRPRVVHQLISGPVGRHLRGRNSKRRVRYQFNCYGGVSLEADTLADAIEQLVDPDGGPGNLYPLTKADITVFDIQVIDRRDQDDVDAGNPTPAPCVQLDLMIWFGNA